MMTAERLKRREYIGGGAKFRHLPPNIDQETHCKSALVVSIQDLYVVDL
jgi:hypothetical protein